jgi:hypothetical protein
MLSKLVCHYWIKYLQFFTLFVAQNNGKFSLVPIPQTVAISATGLQRLMMDWQQDELKQGQASYMFIIRLAHSNVPI